MSLTPDQWGFYHPSNEQEVALLVQMANREKKQIRTCGAAHSQSWAIYTDPVTSGPNVTNQEIPPPDTTQINLLLDQMMDVTLLDRHQGLVRAQAGVHLGHDPSDISGTSTLKNSLLYQLWQQGLTLSEVGGIIHQTLGGFMSTGSAGGSLKYSFQDNIQAIRLVNGLGELVEFRRDDENTEAFFAAMVSMGLFGIVVSVDLLCESAFNIVGQEATVTYQECQFDFFGESADKPSLEDFMRDVDYGRVNWWPQPGAERILPWQAQRIPCITGFTPRPYQEFTNYPAVAEPVISIIYAILGNLDTPEQIPAKVHQAGLDLQKVADNLIDFSQFGILGPIIRDAVNQLLAEEFDKAIALIQQHAPMLKANLPEVMQVILNVFQSLDSSKEGMEKGTPQVFQHHAPWGLPMDNQASDELLDIEFSELWFPIGRANQVMQILRDYFDEASNAHEKLKRTGLFTIEVYMAKACQAWMSMGYTDGEDEWREGAFRFEPLWFVDFSEDPQREFYPQFWRLFRDKGIPFRLHWGKMLPDVTQNDTEGWVDYFRGQYPKWDAFLAMRRKMDPHQRFVSHYWRTQLNIGEL